MKTEEKSLPRFLADSFWLQKQDFWQAPAIVAAVFAILQTMQLVVYAIGHNPEILGMSLGGLFALATAVLMGVLQATGRFCSELRMGVHMSIPRRRMLLSGAVLSLANALEMVLTVLLLQGLWVLAFGRMPQAENLFAAFPLWAWAAAVYVPVGAGLLAGGILMRFGRVGFWVLYGLFMCACFVPQIFNHAIPDVAWSTILAVLPAALPAVAAVDAAAGLVLLWRVPVTE